MSSKPVNVSKRYGRMTKDELREATKQYDAEMINPQPVGTSPDVKARHDRAIASARAASVKRKRGRPVVGQGSTAILISMEKGLLADADAFAKAKDMSRSELVATGLRLLIKREEAPPTKPGAGDRRRGRPANRATQKKDK